MTNPALKTAPKVERLASVQREKDGSDAAPRVDRTGGRYGAGIIRRVSLCSRGEALGHFMWIDGEMLTQIAEADTGAKALKSRFTHPDWCSDGMGKGLGTIEDRVLEGDQVYGDLHFYESAHHAPDGNLADYVMNLAEEDPANFGLSIVFAHDWETEKAFMLANGGVIVIHDDGYDTYEVIEGFQSPDPLNVENYSHARLSELRAADVVDEPAANPQGLFHRENALLSEGGQMLDFILGRAAKAPALSALGVDVAPERLKTFVTKYLAKSGLSIQAKESTMSLKKKGEKLAETPVEDPKKDAPEETAPKEEPTDETKPKDDSAGADEPPADEKPADKKPDETKPKDEQPAGYSTAKLQQFVTKFGAENGSKWAIEGVSYETALERHCDALSAELTDANARLKALGKEGTEPLKFSHGPDAKKAGTNTTPTDKLQAALGDGLAKVAAGIRIPQPSTN